MLNDVLSSVAQRCWREQLDVDRISSEARWLAEFSPVKLDGVRVTRSGDDAHHLATLQSIAERHRLSLVAAGDVHMHARGRKRLQDALTAVRLKTPLAQCGRSLAPNAERYLRPLYRLARIYPTQLLMQTQAIAERCNFSLAELRYEYPEELVPAGETAASWLRRLTYDESARRYPNGMPDKVRAIIEYELKTIAELRYEPFFLTVYDIVRFARSKSILCQGRGSAANRRSAMMGIPDRSARMKRSVRRFISRTQRAARYRLDFEHAARRSHAVHLQTYGRERAAMTERCKLGRGGFARHRQRLGCRSIR